LESALKKGETGRRGKGRKKKEEKGRKRIVVRVGK
jgi:hypothetical protein